MATGSLTRCSRCQQSKRSSEIASDLVASLARSPGLARRKMLLDVLSLEQLRLHARSGLVCKNQKPAMKVMMLSARFAGIPVRAADGLSLS